MPKIALIAAGLARLSSRPAGEPSAYSDQPILVQRKRQPGKKSKSLERLLKKARNR